MPTPKAAVITLSEAQVQCLRSLASQTTNPYRLVRRASLILGAASGATNSQLSQEWKIDRNQVRQWRHRWLANGEKLALCEEEDPSEMELKQQVLAILSDRQRPGVPVTFTPEQVVQIVALACEEPQASGRPISRWTPAEIADEAIKRKIVSRISASSVTRFLGGSPTSAPSESVLVECDSRRPRSV